MEDTRREIRFYGMRPNKALTRQIERQVQKWLRRNNQTMYSTGEATYRVCIEREAGNCLCCHLEIQVGPERWESHDFGKSVQVALSHALQHVARPISQSLSRGMGPIHQLTAAKATA